MLHCVHNSFIHECLCINSKQEVQVGKLCVVYPKVIVNVRKFASEDVNVLKHNNAKIKNKLLMNLKLIDYAYLLVILTHVFHCQPIII